MVQIKRAYEKASRKDGYRVLVDRLWPRGLSKAQVPFDLWLKVLAPSDKLRKAFGHDPKKWKTFQTNYKRELAVPEAKEKLKLLAEVAKQTDITLVYGARDELHNNAVVIKSLIEKKVKRH